MIHPNMTSDVENGTVTSPMSSDHDQFTIGDDDESTLQPPPSESDQNPTINTDFGTDDDEEAVHDQLPTPEEYKAKMKDGFVTAGSGAHDSPSKSTVASEFDAAGDDDDIVHDQLPTVDEYKSSSSFHESSHKKSRAGLYTFLFLLLATVIATAVTIPLVRKSQQESNPSSSNSSSNPPPTASGRLEEAINYLAAVGVSTRESMEESFASPQYKAVKWLAEQDTYQLPVPAASDLNPNTRFTERYVLAVLYYSSGGEFWKYSMQFLEPIDHCDWYQDFVTTSGSVVRLGVTECKTLGSGFQDLLIQKIDLSNNGLTGRIPKEIQHLHRLTHFLVPFNAGLTEQSSLEGLQSLAYLTDVEFQYCSLTGSIPEWFGGLQSLTNLGFGNNFLEGSLPSSFWSLHKLSLLGLDDNSFSGPIAPFGSLSSLNNLYLEDNGFSGQLTESLFSGGWSKMKELDLSGNNLIGPLPANIFSVSSLEVIDLHGNELEDAIPEIEKVQENLFFLALHENQFNWVIPSTINNLPNLAHLDISKNNMVLPFPSTMSQMTNLRYLFTGQNPFEAHTIPGWLAELTKLREISMKDNNLSGSIPTFLGGLRGLQLLDLGMNKLTGSIPEELGLLTGIDTLILNRNELNGTIPSSFAILYDLDVLLLDGNELTGSADVLCKETAVNVTHFIADCEEPNPEIVCKCCSLCCRDSNKTCNNYDWNVNLDPIWEYGYQRVDYTFSQNVLPPNDGNR